MQRCRGGGTSYLLGEAIRPMCKIIMGVWWMGIRKASILKLGGFAGLPNLSQKYWFKYRTENLSLFRFKLPSVADIVQDVSTKNDLDNERYLLQNLLPLVILVQTFLSSYIILFLNYISYGNCSVVFI